MEIYVDAEPEIHFETEPNPESESEIQLEPNPESESEIQFEPNPESESEIQFGMESMEEVLHEQCKQLYIILQDIIHGKDSPLVIGKIVGSVKEAMTGPFANSKELIQRYQEITQQIYPEIPEFYSLLKEMYELDVDYKEQTICDATV